MALYITEFTGGYLSGRPLAPNMATGKAISVQVMSGASTAAQTTSTLSATTRLIRLAAITAGQFFAISGSTGSTTETWSSTNSEYLPTGVVEWRSVSPGARIIASST